MRHFLFLGLLLPVIAQANDNMTCYGVGDLFGSAKETALVDQSPGQINLPKIFSGNPDVSFQGNDSFQQTLKKQKLPGKTAGSTRNADLVYKVELQYNSQNQLVGVTQTTVESGKKDILIGGNASFDWVNGQCRPTKLAVKNKDAFGDSKAVFFDASFCKEMKDMGIQVTQVAACADMSAGIYNLMQQHDAKMRADTHQAEIFVAPEPLVAGKYLLLNQNNVRDHGYALQALANCAMYENIGAPAKAEVQAAPAAVDNAPAAVAPASDAASGGTAPAK